MNSNEIMPILRYPKFYKSIHSIKSFAVYPGLTPFPQLLLVHPYSRGLGAVSPPIEIISLAKVYTD